MIAADPTQTATQRLRPAPPLIALTQVSKVYRMGEVEVRALDDVSLEIPERSFVAIMGASGSGKSTLMNTLGCLDRPTRGSYFLAGRDVSRLSRDQLAGVRNRTIGFIFQSFNLLSRTSALENVELPLIYAGVGRSERRHRARESLALVGLASREGHAPNQLSGGQQQRVAIARALVGRPRVLLGDEPTGNLDSRTSLEVLALLQGLARGGLTVVLVTHSAEIAAFAERVVLVRDGHIVDDRRQAPASTTPDGPDAAAVLTPAPVPA